MPSKHLQVLHKYGNSNTNHSLQEDSLKKAWSDYIARLKEARNPAAQPFELAVLRIKDENTFEAITANNIEQKFIEQERNTLFHFLQQQLQNRLLQFSVIVEENADDRPKIELTLTAKEQFQKIIGKEINYLEMYRIRLELDY